MDEVLDIPGHVPEDLVRDIDYRHFEGQDGPLCWRSLYEDAPLIYTPRNGGHWIAMQPEDVDTIFRESGTFSNLVLTAPDNPGLPMLPDQSDPPMHERYRRVVTSQFTPKSVAGIEQEINELAIQLIEELKQKGYCDFVAEFGQKLPTYTFLSIVDVPREDSDILLPIAKGLAGPTPISKKIELNNQLSAYLEDLIEKRLASPGQDLVSRIVTSCVDGESLTRMEMLRTTIGIFFAGLDTVASFLTYAAWHLANHSEQRKYVRENPDKLFQVGEELLRRFPVLTMGRIVANDCTFKNIFLKKGDILLCPSANFNLSDKQFEFPEKVDFERKPSRHLTFGAGRHTCLGSFLARTEIKIFLREWLNRIPDFEVDFTKPRPLMTGPVSNFTELHLVWDPSSCK